MRKSESLEAVELEIDDVNKQSKRDNEITKEAELESTIKSNLEEKSGSKQEKTDIRHFTFHKSKFNP